MNVPFFDLRVTDSNLKEELLAAVGKVLDHGRLILGPEVEIFEKKVAEHHRAKYAVGVASGSSALFLALKSIGVGPGDEVITTPLTWIVTLNAIAACGATPICVDITEDFNLDPVAIEAAISSKTKAIVPMHYCGYMCEMDKISALAKQYQLKVVEDAAQAYGATYQGEYPGALSDVAIFSMNTMKVLGGYGEAGALITNNREIYEVVKMMRYAGTKSDPEKIVTNECYFPALNHKIDTLQAAMLLVAMRHLPERMRRRREIAQYYNMRLEAYIKTPIIQANQVHALYAYTIQVEHRDKLQVFLKQHGVETKIYHIPIAIDAPVYDKIEKKQIPIARKLVNTCLSIPAHEKLTNEQIGFVADRIIEFIRMNKKLSLENRSIQEGVQSDVK